MEICGHCTWLSDTGLCRIGREARSYFAGACSDIETKNENDMEIKKESSEVEIKEEWRTCEVCGRTWRLDRFARNRWGYTKICKECMDLKRKGAKPDQQTISEKEKVVSKPAQTAQELMQALRELGFHGKLTKVEEYEI